DIFMYDTYGDGWDDGDLTIYNADGDTVAYGTLNFGFGPEPGEGWQNEFVTVRIPIDVLRSCEDQPDLNAPFNLGFSFGMGEEIPGALAIDDIELIKLSPELTVNSIPVVQSQDIILVYPNPASDHLFVQTSGSDFLKRIDISDISGRSILQVETDLRQPIDVSGLPDGVYNLRVESAGSVSSVRFVKLNQ
ncbi:MAG: Secretion system C-terminal sorting domain, partial [Bacteroidota bacterium]